MADKRVLPQPTHGVLDLRGQNLSQRGVISLDGEWEFYWKQLVNYRDISSNSKPDSYVEVPGFWRSYHIGEKALPGRGYATYRLKVKIGQVGERLGLKIQPLSSAYRIYINDEIVAESGVVGADTNTTITRYKLIHRSDSKPQRAAKLNIYVKGSQKTLSQ